MQDVKDLLQKLGFVEELGEYILDTNIPTKMKKIKRWFAKGINKVKELKNLDIDEDAELENIMNE